jgi:hypothetical protein
MAKPDHLGPKVILFRPVQKRVMLIALGHLESKNAKIHPVQMLFQDKHGDALVKSL